MLISSSCEVTMVIEELTFCPGAAASSRTAKPSSALPMARPDSLLNPIPISSSLKCVCRT